PAPPRPAEPKRRGATYAALGLLAVAVVLAGVTAVLLLGGRGGGTSGTTTSAAAPAPVQRPATDEDPAPVADAATSSEAPRADAATSSEARRTGATTPDTVGSTAAAGATFHGDGYTIDAPGTGWVRDHADKFQGDDFYETRWHLKGRPDVVVYVDYTPGFSGTPRSGAEGVRRRPGTPGYVEHRFASDGDDVVWEFSLDGTHKIDRFSTACDTGFAVLGAAPDDEFERHRATFDAVARSLTPTC
ncbi:hypothetical protein AB0L40_20735, partial [Patulibacter sp. NPDC049589]